MIIRIVVEEQESRCASVRSHIRSINEYPGKSSNRVQLPDYELCVDDS